MLVFDVERLLHWAFAEQKADRAISIDTAEATGRAYVRSGDSVAMVEEQGRIGCRIDTSRKLGFAVDPDAETVVEYVTGTFRGRLLGLICHNARIMGRPDWIAGGARLEPVPNKLGKPTVIYCPNRHPLYCPIRYDHTPGFVDQARREYTEWWDALARINGEFAPETRRLRGVRVTGFTAPFAPWMSNV